MALVYPTTLTNGTTADAAQVQGNFDAAKTVIDANTVMATGVAGAWQNLMRVECAAPFGPATTNGNVYALGTATQFVSTAAGVPAVHVVDAASVAIGSLTTQYRIMVQLLTNGTATGASFSFGLHQVTAFGGANSSQLTTTFNSTPFTGSQATFVTPVAFSAVKGGSAAFAAPTDATPYLIAVTMTGTPATNSAAFATAILQVRRV